MLEQNGGVVGYLLGSRKPFRQQFHSFFQNIRLFFKGLSRYPRYKRATRDFIGWILRNSGARCQLHHAEPRIFISTFCPRPRASSEQGR